MKPPAERRTTPSTSPATACWGLLAAMLAFVLIPVPVLKFPLLVGAGWLACRIVNRPAWRVLLAAFATALFASAFLLNPVAAASALGFPGGTRWLPFIFQAGLFATGALWLGCVLRGSVPRLPELMGRVPPVFILLWVAVLVGIHFQSWRVDIAYGGDEHYHMNSLLVAHNLARDLLARTGVAALFVVWLLAGALVLWRHVRSQPSGSPRLWLWPVSGLALAALSSPWFYQAEILRDSFVQERILRYPAAQPWLFEGLWEFAREGWGQRPMFDFELFRFPSLFALAVLGLCLASDARWMRVPLLPRLLAVLAVTSVPTLLYHGTLLYLELALIPVLWLILANSRRWLLAAPQCLEGQTVWWAAVTVGFLKDTGIIAITLLWVARVATRCWLQHRTSHPASKAHSTRVVGIAEARLAFAVLAPGWLYLAFRRLQGARPYDFHFENLISGDCWAHAVRSLAEQFGGLWLLAFLGVGLLARRRAWSQLIMAGTLFAGMGLFHFLDEPRWVGLARFNLLLLPAVLVLAWEGLTAVWRWQPLAARPAILLLLLSNVLLSPVDVLGRRAAWGGSGERWYDFTPCLSTIRQQNSNARIAIANIAHEYPMGLLLRQLQWETVVARLPVTESDPLAMRMETALTRGARDRVDYVLFRRESGPAPGANGSPHHGYEIVADYPAATGGLTLFRLLNDQSPAR